MKQRRSVVYVRRGSDVAQRAVIGEDLLLLHLRAIVEEFSGVG